MNQTPEKLAEILLSGDSVAAWQYIHNGQSAHEIYQQLITPAMRHIGSLWETNQISVADEHVATAVCDMVISRLGFERRKQATGSPARKAAFLCLEGERHYLGLKMACQLFDEYGWDTKFFGADLPLDLAIDALKRWEPEVIGLSVTIVHNLPRLGDYINQLLAMPHSPSLLVGSRLAGKYSLDTQHAGERVIILENYDEMDRWLTQHLRGGKVNA